MAELLLRRRSYTHPDSSIQKSQGSVTAITSEEQKSDQDQCCVYVLRALEGWCTMRTGRVPPRTYKNNFFHQLLVLFLFRVFSVIAEVPNCGWGSVAPSNSRQDFGWDRCCQCIAHYPLLLRPVQVERCHESDMQFEFR